MPAVVIEHTDGRELARIPDVSVLPRVGEHIAVLGDLLIVRTIIWDLSDGPLAGATVIVDDP